MTKLEIQIALSILSRRFEFICVSEKPVDLEAKITLTFARPVKLRIKIRSYTF